MGWDLVDVAATTPMMLNMSACKTVVTQILDETTQVDRLLVLPNMPVHNTLCMKILKGTQILDEITQVETVGIAATTPILLNILASKTFLTQIFDATI